jgi:hypothetical protein
MSRSGVRISLLPRSRRGRLAAPAVLGALAVVALAAPTAAAEVPAAVRPKVIATIRLPMIPAAVAISPRTGTVYIPSNVITTGDIAVVNGTTHKVAATISDDDEPVAAAVSPQTDDVLSPGRSR